MFNNVGDNKTFEELDDLCNDEVNNTRLPNIDELTALFWNANLYGLPISSGHFWSGSFVDQDSAWAVGFDSGLRGLDPRSLTHSIRCVKR